MSFQNNIELNNSEPRTADTKRDIDEILGKINIIEKQLNADNMPDYLKKMFTETLVPQRKNLEIAKNKKLLSALDIQAFNSVIANINEALEQMTRNIKIYKTAEDDYRRMELILKHSGTQNGGKRKIKKSKSKSLRNKRSKKTRKH